MNTIINLNVAANVSYNNEADYAISFGTNLGNTTANVDAYSSANITKQTALNSVSNAVRDLLIDVQFSNVGNVSMAYAGNYSNIGILQVAPSAWRVSGIRSVAQYNESFANVRYTDLTGASAVTPEYSYITTVNDQKGNVRSWTTTVNVIAQPSLVVSGPLIYNEDTLTPITQLSVTVDPGSTNTFRLTGNTASSSGALTDGITSGDEIYIDGNVAVLNSRLAAGDLKFLPASDLVSNITNAISWSIVSGTNLAGNANMSIQIGTAHSEYYFPNRTYNEDTLTSFGDTISDLDTHATSFTVSFQQTSGNIGKFYRNNVLVGNANSILTLTNTRSNINSTVSWLPQLDSTSNATFTYNQLKTLPTGNITQASNVTATWSIGNTNPEISNMIARSYTSNTINNIFSSSTPYINDGPDYGQTYTITLSTAQGKFGNSAPNAIAANTYSFTGNTTLVNQEFTNMVFVPTPFVPGSSGTFTYTQSRDGIAQVNSNVSLTGNTVAYYSIYGPFISSGVKTLASSFSDSYFGSNMQVIAIGGGGGGSTKISGPGGGSGGAGGVVNIENWGAYPYGNVTVYIGAGGKGAEYQGGGATATNGGQTAVVGYNSYDTVTADGGNSGGIFLGGNTSGPAGTFFGGSYYGNATVFRGGGGAGAAGNGVSGTSSTTGIAGIGYTISGVANVVAPGGSGAGFDLRTPATSNAIGAGGAAGYNAKGTNGNPGGAYIIWT